MTSLGGLGGVLVRWLLGGAFVAYALLKLADPSAFLKVLREYGLAPAAAPWMLSSLAALLPWLELVIGLALLLGVAPRGAALLAALLLAVFSTAVFLRGRELAALEGAPLCSIAFDCGCGTGLVNVCRKLAENAGLLLLALAAVAGRPRRLCLRPDLFAARR